MKDDVREHLDPLKTLKGEVEVPEPRVEKAFETGTRKEVHEGKETLSPVQYRFPLPPVVWRVVRS